MTHVLLLLCLTQTPYADGSRLVAEGQFWQALDKLNQAIAQNPTDARAYASRGSAHMGLNRNAAAIADYAYALQLDPALSIAAYGLGRAYNAVGQTDAAQEWFKKYQAMPGADPKLAPITNAPPAKAVYGTPPPAAYTGTKPATPVPAPSALIYLYRNQGYAATLRITVSIDGEQLGDLSNEKYIEINVTPGPHNIVARGVTTEAGLAVVATNTGSQYVVLKMKENLNNGKWTPDSAAPLLEAIPPVQGAAELRNLTKAFSRSVGVK